MAAAEAVAMVLDDAQAREQLVARGRARAEHFNLDRSTATFLDALLEAV